MLRAPTRRGTPALVQISEDWMGELSRELGRPSARPGPAGWAIGLLPEFIDPGYRLDASARHLYHRIEWRRGLLPEFQARAQPLWCRPARHGSDLAIASWATADGGVIAEALFVVRLADHKPPLGIGSVPTVPDAVDPPQEQRAFVVQERQIRAFATLAGTRYPIHDDPAYAREQGFPDVIAQGLLLLMLVMREAGADETGAVEIWFRRPALAGSLVSCDVEDLPPHGALWHLKGADRSGLAVTRFSRPAG